MEIYRFENISIFENCELIIYYTAICVTKIDHSQLI